MLIGPETVDVAVVVGTDDDRRASFPLFVEEGMEHPSVVGVDVRERFIEDHEFGVVDERMGGQGSGACLG
jgi:hypothetical protein